MPLNEIQQVNICIHSWCVACSIAGASLAQTIIGDELSISIMVICMVSQICHIVKAKATKALIGLILGSNGGIYILGRIGVSFVKMVPIIGNCINAAVAATSCEVLGWFTYAILKKGRDPLTHSKSELRRLSIDARKFRKDMETERKKLKLLRDCMSFDDRTEIEVYERIMCDSNSTQDDRILASQCIATLYEKYVN
ncbi:hypothetical protein WA158_002056 [Blastocystis sp. Blastoise]